MNSTRKLILFFSATFLLGIIGFLASLVTAQQLDAPDLIETFPVEPNPAAMAFDGANIWVTSEPGFMLTKLRASDGKFLGRFSVGIGPEAVLFDGASIWAANSSEDTLTKLRACDGAFLGTRRVGAHLIDLGFDGANIWVSNFFDDTVMR